MTRRIFLSREIAILVRKTGKTFKICIKTMVFGSPEGQDKCK